jgi:hypothetical protein
MMNPPPSSDLNYLYAIHCYTPPERNLFILFCETSPACRKSRGSKSREIAGNRRMNNIGFKLFLVILTSPQRFWQHWERVWRSVCRSVLKHFYVTIYIFMSQIGDIQTTSATKATHNFCFNSPNLTTVRVDFYLKISYLH